MKLSEGVLDSVDAGGVTLSYTIVRSARRKRTTQVSVTPERGVVVSVPWKMSAKDVKELVAGRAQWIAARLASLPPGPPALLERTSLPFGGIELPLRFVESPGARLTVQCNFREFEVVVPARMPPCRT